jgi:hypothetical protein
VGEISGVFCSTPSAYVRHFCRQMGSQNRVPPIWTFQKFCWTFGPESAAKKAPFFFSQKRGSTLRCPARNSGDRQKRAPDRPWAFTSAIPPLVVYRGTLFLGVDFREKSTFFRPFPESVIFVDFRGFRGFRVWDPILDPLCASRIIFGKISPLEMLFLIRVLWCRAHHI